MPDIYLWIDDERTPPQGYTHWAKTSEEALVVLQNLAEDDFLVLVSFDHDLGYDPTDGHPKLEEANASYDTSKPVVRWMIKNEVYPQAVQIHSQNPIGAKWIWDSFKYDGPPGLPVVRTPYTPERFK